MDRVENDPTRVVGRDPLPSMRGRVCVVTGPTSGIGKVVAFELARAGATLRLIARDRERAAALEGELRAAVPGVEVTTTLADLSLLGEARRAASEIAGSDRSLHLLINNAGAIFHRREVTEEGHERTWSLNVLAPFLLTSLLVDRLVRSAPARVVNVASSYHRWGQMHFDDLEGEERYGGFRAYGQSKLALLPLTHEFARRLSGTGVSVHAVHPGFVRSRFGRNNPGPFGLALGIAETLFGVSAQRGSRAPLYAAAAPPAGRSTGQYFVGQRPVRSSGASYNEAAALRLWTICCRVCDVAPLGGAVPEDPSETVGSLPRAAGERA